MVIMLVPSYYQVNMYNDAVPSDIEKSIQINFTEATIEQLKLGDTLIENSNISFLNGCRVNFGSSKVTNSTLNYILTETEEDGELNTVMKGTVSGSIASMFELETYVIDSGYFDLNFKE